MKSTKKPSQHHHEFILVAKAHIAEYFNKPLLNIGFIFSLAIATSTLLCILVLNHASKQQYQEANSRLKSPITFNVVHKNGDVISVGDFSNLRKLGFHQLSAAHVFRKQLSNGESISFRAINILPLVLTKPESFTSEGINLSNKYARLLELNTDSHIKIVGYDFETFISEQSALSTSSLYENNLSDEDAITININDINDWGNVALLDITLAWQLFPDINGFSHLMIYSITEKEFTRLENALPSYLSIQETWSIEEREGFADALHLNLSALAILGFIVSLFIAFQAANQAWSKRGELAAQLRLLGVELRTIKRVMWCESLLLTMFASLIGIVIAIALVSVLLPILGLTLDQLYRLRVSGNFQWSWQYSLWAFAISAVAVVVALIKQFSKIGSAKIALVARANNPPFNYNWTRWIALTLIILFILWPSDSWHQLMLKYGLLLMASVALLPNLLQYLLQGMAFFSRSFRLKFVFKDASKQVGRRYLPIAAFYLALTSSISAALMVNSFETSFVTYLNQLLNSDMFIRYNTEQKAELETWLKHQSEVEEYVLFQHTIAKYGADTVNVYALVSDKQQNSLLLKEGVVSPVKQSDKVCYINEQLAYKHSLSIQQGIDIQQGRKIISCVVTGIFYDYGNQGFTIKIPNQELIKELSSWQESGFGVFFNPNSTMSKQDIIDKISIGDEQIYKPEQIKKVALSVFKQTFALTQAIAFVLLSIACFGLFLSANSLELGRKTDLHILSSLGYSRIELFFHMLLQWLLLACGTILLSWPVAIVLANALVSLVLPTSFGWSMPLMLDIAPFLTSSLIGLLILIPALGIPLYKLNFRASLS